jgi:predicted component of type VI protein secretion system
MGAAPILTILKNGETVKSCEIEGEAMLGRSEGCVIRLDDRAISRQHVMFKAVEGGVQVEKKSEFAPLVINGVEQTRAIVREADVISIGPYLMRVSVPKSAPPSQASKEANLRRTLRLRSRKIRPSPAPKIRNNPRPRTAAKRPTSISRGALRPRPTTCSRASSPWTG